MHSSHQAWVICKILGEWRNCNNASHSLLDQICRVCRSTDCQTSTSDTLELHPRPNGASALATEPSTSSKGSSASKDMMTYFVPAASGSGSEGSEESADHTVSDLGWAYRARKPLPSWFRSGCTPTRQCFSLQCNLKQLRLPDFHMPNLTACQPSFLALCIGSMTSAPGYCPVTRRTNSHISPPVLRQASPIV